MNFCLSLTMVDIALQTQTGSRLFWSHLASTLVRLSLSRSTRTVSRMFSSNWNQKRSRFETVNAVWENVILSTCPKFHFFGRMLLELPLYTFPESFKTYSDRFSSSCRKTSSSVAKLKTRSPQSQKIMWAVFSTHPPIGRTSLYLKQGLMRCSEVQSATKLRKKSVRDKYELTLRELMRTTDMWWRLHCLEQT